MSPRFFRRPLGVLVAVALNLSFLTSTSAMPFEEPASQNPPASTQEPLRRSNDQATSAVASSNAAQILPPPAAVPNVTLSKQGEQAQTLRPDSGQALRPDSGQALQNALIHSSLGLKALQAGDRVRAQGELEAAVNILSKLPDGTPPDNLLRLKLIEETAVLRAALSGPALDGDSRASEQEDEADTEESPDLVNPEEEPRLAPPEIPPDSVGEPDLSKFDVPIVLNEKVRAYILHFQTRKSKVIRQGFERAGRYLPMMREIFQEKGLPQDLVNLAYIESAFNYRAFSRARAMGIWQFIKSTGYRYGLRVSHWVDERRDPEKATRAAANYLKDLYGMFNSWPLALAAYNAGEQRIQRAIERQGTSDYWSLRLPKETQLFVPAFMAITIIAKNPEQYGFIRPSDKPWEVERVRVPGSIELASIARAVNVSSDEIRELNAAMLRGVTPVNSSEHEIVLPSGTRGLLLESLDQLPRYRHREVVRAPGHHYRVRPGDTLGKIASRHRTSAAMLAGLNGMKIDDTLQVGALLQLPQGKRLTEPAIASAPPIPSRTEAAVARKTWAPAGSSVHIVKRGDTLWGIAKAYAVTPEELRRWNDLGRRAKLKPGQPLWVATQAAKTGGEAGGASPTSMTAVRYRVKRGDTLQEIAKAHDVTPEELRRWNDLSQRAKLRVGQELTIHLSRS